MGRDADRSRDSWVLFPRVSDLTVQFSSSKIVPRFCPQALIGLCKVLPGPWEGVRGIITGK